MNIALIFPGQGSQYIGMGKDFFDNCEASKQIFNILDETMGLKLSELIFNGSEEELSKTTNSQPAIMSLSTAILEEINATNTVPSINFNTLKSYISRTRGC